MQIYTFQGGCQLWTSGCELQDKGGGVNYPSASWGVIHYWQQLKLPPLLLKDDFLKFFPGRSNLNQESAGV